MFAEIQRESASRLPFDQAFTCGQKNTFTATDARCEYRCTQMFCQSRCESAMGFAAKYDLHVEECKQDSVSIFGDNGLALTIDRQTFETDGTWIRTLLEGAGQFIQPEGHWTIDSAWHAQVETVVGGRLVAIPNVRQVQVQLSFGPAGTQTQSFFILLDLDKSGFDQFLAFGNGLLPSPQAPMFMSRRGIVIHEPGGGIFP